MPIRQSFSDTVGHTPLIRLNSFSDETGCEILGKAEFLNPGGSVKDRAARGILDDFEQKGLLQPGGTLVEGTAGNTGIGFAHLCNARGYRCVIVMPDNQSPEKAALLRTLGAEVQVVKTVPYSDPNHYQKFAPRVAAPPRFSAAFSPALSRRWLPSSVGSAHGSRPDISKDHTQTRRRSMLEHLSLLERWGRLSWSGE